MAPPAAPSDGLELGNEQLLLKSLELLNINYSYAGQARSPSPPSQSLSVVLCIDLISLFLVWFL